MMDEKPADNTNMRGQTKIHNVRFYNIEPRAIQAMAYNKNTTMPRLALSRCDGSIEIWNIEHAAFLERTISETRCKSVEGLAWCGERLFSTGLSGELVEWNLQTLRPIVRVSVIGNAAWCLDISNSNSRIAVGTEQGYITVFDILKDGLQYRLHFDRQEGRVLCCKYDASDNYLVTGSVGCFRIWNAQVGHCIHKIEISGYGKSKRTETIVWSVQVLRDFTILVGDSRGYVSIWDGNNASQLETHQLLKADVFVIAVNDAEDRFLCAGVDPTIRICAKVDINMKSTQIQRWVKFLQRRIHDHDVRCLVCVNQSLYSGGVDGYLGMSSIDKRHSVLERYGPFMQQPCFSVSAKDRYLLMRYPDRLELWRLGYSTGKCDSKLPLLKTINPTETTKTIERLKVVARPKQIAVLKSINNEMIISSAISPNAYWLCYSTRNHIRLFRFLCGIYRGKHKRDTQLICIKDLPVYFVPASHLQFTGDSTNLFLVGLDNGSVNKFSIVLSNHEAIADLNFSPALDFVTSINTDVHIKDSIRHFVISKSAQYVVAVGCNNAIAVWCSLDGNSYKYLLNLPRYYSILTAISFHASLPRLVMAFANGKLIEYDVEELQIRLSCSIDNRLVPNVGQHCVTSICWDQRNADIFILQNDGYTFVVRKCYEQDNGKGDDSADVSRTQNRVKKSRKCRSDLDDVCQYLKFCLVLPYTHYVHLCWLNVHELVAVGVNPLVLLEQMPGAFKQKVFRGS